jgi:stage II sporulation protein D
MKKNFYQKRCLIILFLINAFSFSFIFCDTIKVLLNAYSCEVPFNIKINKANGIIIGDMNDKDCFYESEEDEIDLLFQDDFWYLNGKKLIIENIVIKQNKGKCIYFDGHPYEGKFYIIKNNNDVFFINKLELEDYVEFVVGKESYNGWPLESHKVSAIISRTFAIYKMKIAQRLNKLYDIVATIDDQKYLGAYHNKAIKKAVDETNGLVISYNNEPILSMYHICCGGVIPSKCMGFDFKTHPYLARNYGCNHCNNYSGYNWEMKISHREFCKKLSNFLNKEIFRIVKVENQIKSKSGSMRRIILKVIFIDKKGKKITKNITLNNKQFRQALLLNMQTKSAYFYVKLDCDSNLIISGKGQGHHMGLCQRGAKSMIDSCYSYKEILKFYYPKTEIIKYKINKY